MTTTEQSLEGADPDGGSPAPGPNTFTPEPGTTRIEVALGRRVMVVSDLLLTAQATPSTSAVSAELARALDTWDGPGLLIIAGNLFDLTDAASPAEPSPDGKCADDRQNDANYAFEHEFPPETVLFSRGGLWGLAAQ